MEIMKRSLTTYFRGESSLMHILSAGVHYEKTPIEIREKIVFPADTSGEAMKELTTFSHIHESVILSTCNRTEIYVSTDDVEAGFEAIEQFISEKFSIDVTAFKPYLTYMRDEMAILHLFRMATGLDSLVIGETQILGQVKDALSIAQNHKSTDKLFNELFKRVITFAKRMHKETAVGEQAVSVSYVAVELARKVFGDIKDKHVLVIGAGETGELTLKNLQGAGVTKVTVANRTFEKAAQLADQYRSGAVAINQLEGVLGEIDIVISSTAANDYVLTKEMIEPLQKQRKGRPLFMIDIAVPRDLDPGLEALDDIFLYDMDDLELIVQENMQARRKIADSVEKRLFPELASFNNWVAMLDAVPVIKALLKKSQSIQEQTLESIQRKIPDLTEREIKVLNKHTKSIVHQILEEPIQQAKTMGRSVDDLQKFRDIFGLEEES